MKKYLSILLILMLSVTMFSCKKNAETDDPYIESVGREDNEKEQTSASKEQEKNEVSESKTEQKIDDISKEEVQLNEQPKAETEGTVQSETQQQPIDIDEPDDSASLKIEYSGDKFAEYIDKNSWDKDYSYATDEQKTTYDFSDVFGANHILSDDYVNEYGIPSVNSGEASAFVDGVEYSRYLKYSNQFPAKSLKYAYTDVSKLKSTDEYVDVWFFLPSETGSVYPHGFVKAQVFELSDDMKNDPYVKTLAVKLPDGQSILLYNYDNSVLYQTIGTRLETMHTHFGWDCDSADDIESFEISSEKGTAKITDRDRILKMYELLCKAEYSENFESGKIIFSDLHVNFKDGHKLYEYMIGENGIKAKKMKTPDGFNDFVFSLFE